ncbi:MAG: DUF5696 domain-containing protein [Roseburia sp.]|nr:DUF5696 domain-containing protein [Roseburia sp.]MCM1099465.1 DUF5696 domain-containing protein [Ruminococcus flavefaciens]
MFCKKQKAQKWIAFGLIPALLLGIAPLRAEAYVATNRDTRTAPEKALYEPEEYADYEFLLETGSVRYYWREDRDVLAVVDKQTGYCIKTGADLPFSGDVKDAVKALEKADASPEEILAAAESYPDDLNSTYVGIANSLVTLEYYDSDKIKYISSASEDDAESALSKVEEGRYCLDIRFQKPEVQMKVYITLGEESIDYYIPYEEMTGSGLNSLAAVDITPFLGASGGRMNVMNPETLEWEKVDNYRVPGYVLVPDGSGSLIRFVDNTSVFNAYEGDVYGKDYATETNYSFAYYDDVPVKDPVMPVFGIAHGNGQMAFAAWANEGAEYMDIIVNPDGTKATTYTWAYPRFELNINYYQLYDEQGSGFFKQMDEIYRYNIDITYAFLFGDGSDGTPSADYVGMARVYREYLIQKGELTPLEDFAEDIPIRLDFIMADSKSGIVGNTQVEMTTAEDVEDILGQVMEKGITNISSGLIGWQKGGESLSKPYKLKFSGAIGSKGDFKKLIRDFAEQGVDISLSRDTVTVNKKMVNYYNTAVKCISNWYLSIDKSAILPENVPTYLFSYATPEKAAAWTGQLADKTSDFSESLTLTGLPHVLTSNWNRDGVITSLTESIELYRNTLEEIGQETKLNLENPNMYLWKYTDRYLQIPVGSSQFIFETDAVPFLELVLHGTMELYAPYANFSFYTQDCILRMIDYNISPAFILSKEPSYKLSDTFSANYYSTEYTLYEDLIQDVYGQINGALSQVQGYEWTNRYVPEDGVAVNTYQKGGQTKYIIINYTEHDVTWQGTAVSPESAAVVGKE